MTEVVILAEKRFKSSSMDFRYRASIGIPITCMLWKSQSGPTIKAVNHKASSCRINSSTSSPRALEYP